MRRKKRILIVEDEESLLKLETILLTCKGFEVIGAFTGKMAIDKIGVEEFDLVLLDIMLPDIDGFEVCRLIRKDPRTAYIVKPFKSAMIIDEINKLLTLSEDGA